METSLRVYPQMAERVKTLQAQSDDSKYLCIQQSRAPVGLHMNTHLCSFVDLPSANAPLELSLPSRKNPISFPVLFTEIFYSSFEYQLS